MKIMINMMKIIRYIVHLTAILIHLKPGVECTIIFKSYAMASNPVNWIFMTYLLITKEMIYVQFNAVRTIPRVVLTSTTSHT